MRFPYQDFLNKLSQPRPRYGLTLTTRKFKVGARVRYAVPNVSMSVHGLHTGMTGVVTAGDGLPSKSPGSKGTPVWTVQWDNGHVGPYFEWALELA